MLFYEEGASAASGGPLHQGDVLVNVPFLALSASALVIAVEGDEEAHQIDVTTGSSIPAGGFALAEVELGMGILLNQSCDVTGDAGREKPVVLARVRPLTEHTDPQLRDFHTKTALQRSKLVRALANPGQNPNMFYLPPARLGEFALAPSFVDLLDTVTLAPSDAVALRPLRRARLSAEARRAFQERLAYLFGRFGAHDSLYHTDEEAEAARQQAAVLADERRRKAEVEAQKEARRAAVEGGRD